MDCLNITILTKVEKGLEKTAEKGKEAASTFDTIKEKAGDAVGNLTDLAEASDMVSSAWDVVLSESPELQQQFDRISDSIRQVAGPIGDSLVPAFETVADIVENASDSFMDLPEPVHSVIGVAFALVSALVGIGVVVATLKGPILAIAGLMTGLLAPIIFLAAAIGGLYLIWKHDLFGMRDTVEEAVAWIQSAFEGFVAFMEPLVKDLLGDLTELWGTHFGDLVSETEETFAVLESVFESLEPLFEVLKDITKVAWAIISTVIVQNVDAFLTAIRVAMAFIRGDFDEAGEIIMDFVERSFERFSGLAADIKSILSDLGTRLKELGAEMMANLLGAIQEKLEPIGDAIGNVVKAVTEPISELVERATEFGEGLMDNYVSPLEERKEKVSEAVDNVAQVIRDVLPGLADSATQWGSDLVDNFVSGIESKFDSLRNVADRARDIAEDPLSFDIVANDRAARRWGSDLIQEFSRGVEGNVSTLERALPGGGPGAFGLPQPHAAGGGRTTVDVTVEAGAVQLDGGGTARINAERTADGIGQELANQFGRR